MPTEFSTSQPRIRIPARSRKSPSKAPADFPKTRSKRPSAKPKLHAEEDKKRAEAVDIKNKGENIIYQVEKQISELPEEAPADLKEMLTTKLDAVKGALKADDLDLIKSTTEDLEKSLAELAQAAQAAGAQMPDMGGAAPDVERR